MFARPSVSVDPVSVSVLRVSCLCNIAQSFIFLLQVLLFSGRVYLDALGSFPTACNFCKSEFT